MKCWDRHARQHYRQPPVIPRCAEVDVHRGRGRYVFRTVARYRVRLATSLATVAENDLYPNCCRRRKLPEERSLTFAAVSVTGWSRLSAEGSRPGQRNVAISELFIARGINDDASQMKWRERVEDCCRSPPLPRRKPVVDDARSLAQAVSPETAGCTTRRAETARPRSLRCARHEKPAGTAHVRWW